jgi:hypothetical protein
MSSTRHNPFARNALARVGRVDVFQQIREHEDMVGRLKKLIHFYRQQCELIPEDHVFRKEVEGMLRTFEGVVNGKKLEFKEGDVA